MIMNSGTFAVLLNGALGNHFIAREGSHKVTPSPAPFCVGCWPTPNNTQHVERARYSKASSPTKMWARLPYHPIYK